MRSGAARKGRLRSPPPGFVLYVEGARDREILGRWAHCVDPPLARTLDRTIVILGGRQPGRATEHFRKAEATRALCVLDRDGMLDDVKVDEPCEGLEFYTWPRRHIESYLLVPTAVCRSLRLPEDDPRLGRLFREFLPDPEDEAALKGVDAKRLLSQRSPLAQGLGRPISPGRVARAMRRSELHEDVLGLVARLGAALGRRPPAVVDRRT